MNLLSKLTYAVAGMALSTALLAGTPVTFAQEDTPTVNQRTTGSRNASAAVETAADVLGITVEALQDYYADGFSLSDVIADLGLDEDTVRAELRTAIQADKLGISAAELQTRLDAGETLREIAADLGVELQQRGRRSGRNNR